MLLVACLAPLILSRESTPPARPALQRSQPQHAPAARGPPARRPDWVLHDHFNLAALPVAVGLSAGSLCGAGGRTDLALTAYMLAYFATDTLWIAARPAIVRTPRTLLFHHALTLLLLLHPLLHPPHRRYTAWMTIVELNTWLLVARRHFKKWRLALDTIFGITWVRAARRIAHRATLPLSTDEPRRRRRSLSASCGSRSCRSTSPASLPSRGRPARSASSRTLASSPSPPPSPRCSSCGRRRRSRRWCAGCRRAAPRRTTRPSGAKRGHGGPCDWLYLNNIMLTRYDDAPVYYTTLRRVLTRRSSRTRTHQPSSACTEPCDAPTVYVYACDPRPIYGILSSTIQLTYDSTHSRTHFNGHASLCSAGQRSVVGPIDGHAARRVSSSGLIRTAAPTVGSEPRASRGGHGPRVDGA